MSEKFSNLNEALLAKKLGIGLSSLNEMACSLEFEDLVFPTPKKRMIKPLSLVASILIAVTLVFGLWLDKGDFSNTYQARNLSPLIKQSQILESKIAEINNNSEKTITVEIIKAFYEIEKIDQQLEKFYSKQSDFKQQVISEYWQKRIDKLNVVLQLLNHEVKPIYI